MVVFILIGSTIFSSIFQGYLWRRVDRASADRSLPGGQVGFLVFVNIFVFILAFFLDFFEIAFIVIPLLAPVAEKLGIDLIWFGVLIGANMQTSFMHPPFGFALFYLRGVAPPRGEDHRHLSRRDPLGRAAAGPGGDPDLLPADRDRLSRHGPIIDPNAIQELDIPTLEEIPAPQLAPQ